MQILTKVGKQALIKASEKAKTYFQKEGHNVLHSSKQAVKETEAIEKPVAQELKQGNLARAKEQAKAVDNKGITADSTHTAKPANETSGDTSSGNFKSIEQDKPAYNPNLPDARAKAKENDKGLSR